MRNIMIALHHQKLRKQFPQGVKFQVVQTGKLEHKLFATLLHNNKRITIAKADGNYGIAVMANLQWEIIAGLEKANVHCEVAK